MEKNIIEFLVSHWQWVLGVTGSILLLLWRWSLKHAEWKGRTDESVISIKESLNQIRDYLMGVEFYRKSSPLELTKDGSKVADSTNMREWVKDYVRELSKRVNGKEEYEIYEECEKFIEKNMKDSKFSHNISKGAYNTGVNKSTFKKILSIVLRDEVLKSLKKH